MSNATDLAKGLKNAKQKADGNWEACCPVHNDRTASLSISNGDKGVVFHCHAGCPQEALVAYFRGTGQLPEHEKPAAVARQRQRIVKEYDYVDHTTGEVVMQVCRMEPKSFRQRRPDGKGGWIWSVGSEQRILYNAPAVAAAGDRPVLIVEGEKDVDNLTKIGLVATCNPGGAGKWQSNYNDLLRGRDVIIIADNDQAGRDHASLVGKNLYGVAARVRILNIPGLPEKGDISDWLTRGGTRKALGDLVQENAVEYEPVPSADNDNESVIKPDGMPFRPLGYNNGIYYYMAKATKQVTELTGAQHTKSNLLMLADLSFWQTNYASTQEGFNVLSAANFMIRACHAAGIFTDDAKRGRGAWFDDGRVVVHCGDKLYVDRTPTDPGSIISDYVYEQGKRMTIAIDDPLPVTETRRYVELLKMLAFERDQDAIMVAGWCAIAHVCGALNWRPHIWITGGRGTGKSYTLSNVIKPLFEGRSLPVSSATTAAGIRQHLGSDAIPVLFDEAEGTDEGSNRRIQDILELVRQSSSETGTAIIKGTQGGKSKSYIIRSCFMFASINANIIEASDKSRFTVVDLKAHRQRHTLEELGRARQFLTDEYMRRWQARSVNNLAITRANAVTFAAVMAAMLGEQRAGDQAGALLAGAYGLHHDGLADFDTAKAWVEQWDWSHLTEDTRPDQDEHGLIEHIIQSRIEVTVGDKTQRMPIAEAIERGLDTQLHAYGIRKVAKRVDAANDDYAPTRIFIMNDSLAIKKMLKGTRWEASDYSKVLRRAKAANAESHQMRVGAYRQRRGVSVDILDD